MASFITRAFGLGGSGGASVKASRPKRQAGAIPFRYVDEDVTLLVVTSRRTGRWKFPKGSLIKGCTAAETAAQEAFEEAGVRGEPAATPVGAYRDKKIRGDRQRQIEVELYPLEVTEVLPDWPEKDQRQRHWATLPELQRLIADPHVVELAAAARHRALRDRPPAMSVAAPTASPRG